MFQLEKLGEAIDTTTYTGRGSIPSGGTTGQVPKKQSDDDYDVIWEDVY